MANPRSSYSNGNGKNHAPAPGSWLPTIVMGIGALVVTILTTLGGFATFRDYVAKETFNQYKDQLKSERKSDLDALKALKITYDHRMDAMTLRITEVERKFTSSYSVGDEIRRMQTEIQSLRGQLTGPRTVPMLPQGTPQENVR